MITQKISLAPVSEPWMHLRNAALVCTDAFLFQDGDTQWQCHVLADSFHNFSQHPPHEFADMLRNWACTLHLRMAGYNCTCHVEHIDPFIMKPLMGEDIPFLPQELGQLVVEGSVDTLLQHLSHALGYTCECRDIHLMAEPADDTIQDSLTGEQGLMLSLHALPPHEGKRTRIFMTHMAPQLMGLGYDILTKRNATKNTTSIPAHLAHIHMPFSLVWQTIPLMPLEIAQLETGDCLLMPPSKECVPVHMLCGHSIIQAQLNLSTGDLRLETHMQEDNEHIPHTEDQEQTESAEGLMQTPLVHPKDCPIPIHCHLGTVSLSLEAVTQLTPGMILGPLERLASCVTLSIGGSTIGRATLVDIEGRVGVQVTEIFSQESST